jgi:hypothetical protein
MKQKSKTRFVLIALGLLSPSAANAAIYYVAPDGSDNAPGTVSAPFASWAKGQSAVSAGDTVLFRTGTYTYTKAMGSCGGQTGNVNCVSLDKSGSSGKLIHYMACPGERPVFDFYKVADDCRIRGVYVPGNWIHLKGLELRGVPQNNDKNHESWCIYITGSHNLFELLDTHHNMGPGIIIWGGDANLVLNCDSHDNFDEHTSNGAGESADGFGAHTSAAGGAGNIFRGCRAWWNTDDGYDCITNKEVAIFENCWAWLNGYKPGTSTAIGNGNGFKLGGYGNPPSGAPASPPQNIARRCLSFLNRSAGFYQNHHPVDNIFYNNTAYKNGVNFNTLGYKDGDASMGIYKNNIAFTGVATGSGGGTQAVDNSWNLSPAPAASDFLSVDTAGIYASRKPNGDLPDVKFMRLAGSKYIDKGVDVGLPFSGAVPDLGAFETGAVSTADESMQRKVSRKAGRSSIEASSMEYYDLSGRRIFPAAGKAAGKPAVYAIRPPSASNRTTLVLYMR